MEKRSYKFGKSYLHLVFGNISTSDAQVLVSSDDYQLTMSGGVAAELHKCAGETLLVDVAKKTPASLGDVVVTTAGALLAEHIFHVITIGHEKNKKPAIAVIEEATCKCLELLLNLGINSIAFPALGTGVAGFSPDDVAFKMAEVISKFLKKNNLAEFNISIYLYDHFRNRTKMDYISFFEQFATLIGTSSSTAQQRENSNVVIEKKELSERGLITRKLSKLTRERESLELKLCEFSGSNAQEAPEGLKNRVKEIHKERLELLKQLPTSKPKGIKIFISYSHNDREYLKEFRSHLKVLERIGLVKDWHDRSISSGTEWKGQVDENSNQADVIILLISASFIESEYCLDVEINRALTRHENKEALVVPVLIKPVIWSDLPFAKLQFLPSNEQPVSTWSNKDLAWMDITEGLKAAIFDFQSREK